MVQTLLVEFFENSKKILSVGREQIGLRSDFVLKNELREFQGEYKQSLAQDVPTLSGASGPPVIRVRINGKLVRMPRREIVASQTFERKIKAERNSMKAIIGAFDRCIRKVLQSIVVWTLKTGETRRLARLNRKSKSSIGTETSHP